MDNSKYCEIVNGDNTYKRIANELLTKGSCIIGWTDGEYDHRDILFTYHPSWLGGLLQGGLIHCYLYVSVMRYSTNGFLIESDTDNTKDNNYIKEKLYLHENSCDDKICELVNGVIKKIDELSKQN